MPKYNERWETAKEKFETATGVKKPKPKGFFSAFFNHTGLTTALKEADLALDNAYQAKPDEKPKLIVNAGEKVPKLVKAINDYLKILEGQAKDEKADANAKTQLYRHLKVLSGELKDISAKALQTLDAMKVSEIKGIDQKEKAGKIMKTSLASAISAASLAVKKVQADPTTFKALFSSTADTPGRKIQVQLLAAAKLLKEGKLPNLREDPEFVASKFNPWQGQNTPKSVLPPTATPNDIQDRLNEFKNLLKLAADFSNQL